MKTENKKLRLVSERTQQSAKSAFTLIELLVYMAILGFIIVVAGRAYSDSSIMRVRSQNMLKTAEQVGRVSNLMREDISQMGAKAWGRDTNLTNSPYLVSVSDSVYMAATAAVPDSSSYTLTHGTAGDSIVFRKAAFDTLGKFLCTREIAWYSAAGGASPDGTPLMDISRKCRTVISTNCVEDGKDPDRESICPSSPTDINEAPAVLVGQKAKTFKLLPSVPGVSAGTSAAADSIFPPAGGSASPQFKLLARSDNAHAKKPTSISNGGLQTEISGFAWNNPSTAGNSENANFNQLFLADFSVTDGDDAWQQCIEIPSIQSGETYSVEFKMPFSTTGADSTAVYNSTQFQTGIDHIAVGLRDKSGNPIADISPDVMFYAPQSTDAANKPLYAEFSAKKDIGTPCCLAITTAFYSPKANKGKLKFSNFKILKKQNGAYHYARTEDGYAPEYGTESDSKESVKQKQSVKAFELLLEIDNNGEIAGTYSKESKGMTIPVPNNGVASKPSN